MAIVLALRKLYDDVSAYFEEEAPGDVSFYFGWREPHKHKTAAKRITFVPGDPTGALGEIKPPRFPGASGASSGPDDSYPDIGRPLANLAELFTVRVEAYDATSPEDESVQYQAVRELYDAWYKASYLAAYGNFEVVSSDFDKEYNNRRHGAAIVVVCSILAVIPDDIDRVVQTSDAEIETGYDGEEQGELTITDETPEDVALVSAPIIAVQDGGEVEAGKKLFWSLAVFTNATNQQNYLMRNGVPQVIAEGETYTVTEEDVTEEAAFFIRSVGSGEGDPITSDSETVIAGAAPPIQTLEGVRHWWVIGEDDTVTEGDNDIIEVVDRISGDDLIQTTELNKPDYVSALATLGNKPAGLFGSGGRTFLRNAALSVPIPQPFTVWVVVSVPLLSDWSGIKSICGSVSNRWFIRSNGGAQLEVHAGSGLAVAGISLAGATRYGIVVTFNGAQSKIRVNGVTVYSGATNVGSNPLTDFILGDETPAGLHFTGHAVEAGACSGDLISDIDQLGVLEEWIADNY
jgi:hypothetical protein